MKDPGDANRCFALLGAYYDNHGNIPSSIRYYKQAIDVHSDYPNERIMIINYKSFLVNLYSKINEHEKAKSIYNACMEFLDATEETLHPALLETYLNLTRYALNEGMNISSAEELLQKAIADS